MNKDTIYRQDAIDAISCDITVTGRQNAEVVAATIGAFADRIKALPSAEPEIIQCKDCIYFDKYIDYKEMYQWDGFCADWARNTYENWYCSRAERQEG